MNVNIIRRLEIKKLKGLRDVTISFSDTLTAIMGVNGSGKTTVLHVLACIYMRERSGEEYKFSNFLVPNPDSQWAGSELKAVYWQGEYFKAGINKGKRKLRSRIYTKASDRWAPPYSTRPKRDVFYLGIDTCLPEIERKRRNTFLSYTTKTQDDRISNKVIKKAAYILDKDYVTMLKHKIQKIYLYGVQLHGGLQYSALSMGTGEQRVLKILDTIFNAPEYSLILIDEIDLLLHINALKKLLRIINQEATRKNLQVIFTTHSLIMSEFDFIEIRYLDPTPSKTLIFNSINTGMIYNMTGEEARSIKLYVEDNLSQAIVKKVAKELNMLKKIDVHLFGAAENAFTLAASIILKNEPKDNILIIIDGDVYIGKENKLEQIKKSLSGTEDNIQKRWEEALTLIDQYTLPEDCMNPEKFIHKLLTDENNGSCELVDIARDIKQVDDNHRLINIIVERLGDNYDVVINDILAVVSTRDEWFEYTSNIRNWLKERSD